MSTLQRELIPVSARWRLLFTAALTCVVLALVLFCPRALSEAIIRQAGYYFTLAAVISVGVSLYACVRQVNSQQWKRLPWCWGALMTLLGAWLLFVHVDLGFKIAMDEYLLASTATNLHDSREVVASMHVPSLESNYGVVGDFLDKRPWLYPFVVASVHDVFGYHSLNPFIVNAVVAVVFLLVAFLLGWRLCGLLGGGLSVLLWVSLPLLAQNASGGGIEMLNLFLLQTVVLLSVEYLRRPTARLESLLCLVGVLLAYTRYESGLFFIPILIVVLLGWIRAKQCFCSWGMLASPLLLAGLLLHLKIYLSTESAWELTGGASQAFAWGHVVENVPHALVFFFSGDHQLANSILLSGVGALSVVLLLCFGWRSVLCGWNAQPTVLVLCAYFPFFIIQFLSVVGFHAGRLDSPFVSRYALPLHLLLVIFTVVAVGLGHQQWPRLGRLVVLATGIFIVGSTLPMNAKAVFSKRNFAVTEQGWLEDVSESKLLPDSLVVDRYAVPWTLRNWAVLSPELTLAHAADLKRDACYGRFTGIYVVERMVYREGMFVPIEPIYDSIREKFDLELIAERSFRPFALTCVYRVLGVEWTAISSKRVLDDASALNISVNGKDTFE